MKRYVQQLLEDLESSCVNSKHRLNTYLCSLSSTDYCVVEEDEGGIKLSDLMGIEQFMFPSLDWLEEFEAEELANAMIKVYNASGLNPLFPSCVSIKVKYGLLREYISAIVYPEDGDLVDVEMCDFLPSHCPLAEQCQADHRKKKCCCERRLNDYK